MTSLMFNIYFKTFELDHYDLVEVTFSSSSTHKNPNQTLF
jgi:hypothetical protein